MSTRLPDVRLDGGVFTYEDNMPVFIDDNDTRHYDKGRSMEMLFRAGMAFQREQDSAELAGKDRRIISLSGELRKTQEAARSNLALGARLQHAQDQKYITEQGHKAYALGRADQAVEDHEKAKQAYAQGIREQKVLSASVIEGLAQENTLLRKKVTALTSQLQKSRRITELNLSPRATKRENSKRREQESSTEMDGNERFREDRFVDEEDMVVVYEAEADPSDETALEREKSDQSTSSKAIEKKFEPKEHSFEDRIKWLCEHFQEHPSQPVPEWFVTDLTDAFIAFCYNSKEGFPKVRFLIESLYNLPGEVDLNSILRFPLRGREGAAWNGIRSVLIKRKGYASFRLLLVSMREQASLSKNKSLRTLLTSELESMYLSVQECLDEGQVQLASNKVNRLVKSYRKNSDPSALVHELEVLSCSENAVLLARDHMINLLKKDPSLFPQLNHILLNVLQKYRTDSERKMTDLYQAFRQLNIPAKLLIETFGLDLASSCQEQPLPKNIVCKELLEFWTDNREQMNCCRALYVNMAHCPVEDKKITETYVQCFITLTDEKKYPEDMPAKLQVASYLNLCLCWEKHIVELKLRSIGTPLTMLWDKVRMEASPQQRKDFVLTLRAGVGYYQNDPVQLINFLYTLKNELTENKEQWNVKLEFLRKLLRLVGIVSKKIPPEIEKGQELKELLAKYAASIWRGIDNRHPDFHPFILSSGGDALRDDIIRCLEGTSLENSIPTVQRQVFKMKVLAQFQKFFPMAQEQVKFSLPEGYWKELSSAAVDYLAKKQIENESGEKLFYYQFMAFVRNLVIKKYYERFEQVKPDQLFQMEKAANCFAFGVPQEFSDDLELRECTKEFFMLVARPKETLHRILSQAASKSKNQLPENFWSDIEDEIIRDLDKAELSMDYQLDFATFIIRARNLVTDRLIASFHPVTQEVLINIDEVTNCISTPIEDHFKKNKSFKNIKMNYFISLCRAALKSQDIMTWEHYATTSLDLHLKDFFKFDCFDIQEWKRMAILCAKSEDEHIESIIVQNIVDYFYQRHLSQEETASLIADIATAYYDAGKIDQYIFFLNDEKTHLTPDQANPLIKKLDGLKLSDRETLMAVIELRKHFITI